MTKRPLTAADRRTLGLIVDRRTFEVVGAILQELEREDAERAASFRPLPPPVDDEAEWRGEVL